MSQEPADEQPDDTGDPDPGQPQPPEPPDGGDDDEPPPSPQFLQLAIDIEGQGAVDAPDGPFDVGAEITLTATAADGWRFDRWTGGIDDTANPLTLTLGDDLTIVAIFIQQFQLDLTVEGQGSVEVDPPGDIFDAGTLVTLTATPSAQWEFNEWVGLESNANPVMVTMDADRTVVAVFGLAAPAPPGGPGPPPPPPPPPPVPNEFVLTIDDDNRGTVTVTPRGAAVAVPNGRGFRYEEGSNVRITATGDESSCFLRFGGDVSSTSEQLNLTINSNTFVRVEFVTRPIPVLDAHLSSTRDDTILITGVSPMCGATSAVIEVSGPAAFFEVPVVNGAFSADVPLSQNRTNALFFTTISDGTVRGSPTSTTITRDNRAPSLFVDFPVDGAEVTTEQVDVGGRVSDLLSGFMGLEVNVNGVEAVVDVGIGTNGTFVRPAVPLAALGPNTITVAATDVLGNTIQRSITVTRVVLPPNTPQMEVISGNAQTAQIGSLLDQPITVRVMHGNGTPFANKIVSFNVTRSNGRLFPVDTVIADAHEGSMMLQVRTGADGLAQTLWRMGFDAGCGNNRVEVTSTSIAGTALLCASANPAPAAQINVGTGNNQRAEIGGPAPAPLRVWVNDGCNGVENIPVVFTVKRGDGRVNDRTSVIVETSDTGHAEVTLILGDQPGNNVVEATFPGNPTSVVRFVVLGIDRDETRPTSFSGVVLDNGDNPIQGVTCSLTVQGTSVLPIVTDIDGRFRFDDVPGSGPAGLHVDGLTAFHVGGEGGRDVPQGSFPSLHFETVIVPNAENSLPTPALLPELNPNNARTFDNTQDVELTVEGLAGLKMIVKAGSMTRADGTVPSSSDPAIIALNQVNVDKIPMPMPDGAAPPFSWTLQPGGARFDPPVQVIYPNMSGLPAGSIAYFLSFNHDTMRFEIIATGQVSDDASRIVTDPGAGISTAGWGCNCPPYSVTGDCCDCTGCEECVSGECVSTCRSCAVCTNGGCRSAQGASCAVANDLQQCISGECRDGSCVPTGSPAAVTGVCCENNQDCTEGEVCRFGICDTSCESDADCDDGDECTYDLCRFASCVTRIADCSCETAQDFDVCDQFGERFCQGDRCVDCVLGSKCGPDEFCTSDDRCVQCETDTDCLPGEVCSADECLDVCFADPDCDDFDACTGPDRCDQSAGQCRPQFVLPDCCVPDREGQECISLEGHVGACRQFSCIVPCFRDDDCTLLAGLCSRCVDGECEVFEDGTPCLTVEDCAGACRTGTCEADECEFCDDGTACSDGGTPGRCLQGTCEQCATNTHCPAGQVCVLGTCVTSCRLNADCEDGDPCTKSSCGALAPGVSICSPAETECSCGTAQDGADCRSPVGSLGTCSQGSCVAFCESDSDCTSSAGTCSRCVDGACDLFEDGTPCLTSGDCAGACRSGSCEADDCASCPDGNDCNVTGAPGTCFGGFCVCTTCSTCQRCNDFGACVTDLTVCEAQLCEDCIGGSCVEECNPNDCESCDGRGQCVVDDPECDLFACEICDGFGRCEDVCKAGLDCHKCDNGTCRPRCDQPGCFCGLCAICNPATGFCDPDPDSCCDQPDDTPCGICQTCFQGTCSDACESQCATCRDGSTCVSDCEPFLCEVCDLDTRECTDACDAQQCRKCDIGSCKPRCDIAGCFCGLCEICHPLTRLCEPDPDSCCDQPDETRCGDCLICYQGTCQDCSALNGECVLGQCDPGTGQCLLVARADGTPCLDQDPCTDDVCRNGSCEVTPIPNCP